MGKILFLTILFLFGLALFPLQSTALTISPAKIILSADPGQTIETVMRVRNDLDRTLVFSPTFEGYTSKGDEPVFFPVEFGLPTWITTDPPKVTLEKDETAAISVRINIPEDAEPGGHYAAIFWSSAAPGREGTGIGIVTRVGALVLLEVSGDVQEKGEIEAFSAIKKFFTHLPVGFTYSLKNSGNVYLIPSGKVVIRNIFGKTAAVLEANPGGIHVLPDNSRVFYTANWEPKGGPLKVEGEGLLPDFQREIDGLAFGYYKANLAIEYGRGEIKTAKANFGFWVLPVRILTLFALILGIIILGLIKGIQKYNKWLIVKAKEGIRKDAAKRKKS